MNKNTIKNTLDFQLTKIDGNLLVLNNKNIHNLSFRETGNKKKLKMNKSIETVIIRGQQKFYLYDRRIKSSSNRN